MSYDSTLIVYTGITTSNIPITAGQDLQTILQNIDDTFGSVVVPDYSSYDLYCITQIDGSSHPTNTQNFAEGISKIVCDNRDDFDEFVSGTYTTAIDTLTTSVNGILAPALTYAPFSITSADSLSTVYSKMFTGFTGYNTALNPSSANWGTLSISPSPTTVTNGFNSLITYLSTLTTTVSGKQASLGTFDNSANCLGGGATDTALQTINYLRTYVCTLPEFAAGDITEGCLTAQSDLQDWMQHIVDTISGMMTEYVGGAGAAGTLTYTAGTSCNPATLTVNVTSNAFHKVAVDSSDATYGFLEDKVNEGTGITITKVTDGGIEKMEFSVTDPNTNEVIVNDDDSTPGPLATKIPSNFGTWGLSLISTASGDNSQLLLAPQVTSPDTLVANILNYISTNPTLLAQFCAIIDQCDSPSCNAPTSLVVVLDGSEFELTWTAGAAATSQTAKYRQRGNSDWISTSNIDPANPLSGAATTTNIDLSAAPNIVYQFQVDTNCTGGTTGSDVFEMILYDCVDPTVSQVARVITASQPALTTVDQIEYKLVDKSSGTVIETIVVTGINPVATFAVVPADTYVIWSTYGTLVNGVMLYSSDASQLGAVCISSDIVVP